MLLYVTTDEPRDRRPRPLPVIPDTINRLYDLGMRDHDRSALLLARDGNGWGETPDWRFDREVIRLALYAQERLEVHPQVSVAIVGPVRPLSLSSEFAMLGLGATVLGLSHELGDGELGEALKAASVRLAFATDGPTATRLLGLRFRAPSLKDVVAPDGGAEGSGFVSLSRVLDFGATLDTAERASRFREAARAVDPDCPACAHPKTGGGLEQLTHREGMARVRERLVRLPALPGDIAYVGGETWTASLRWALCAFVGDGYTTIALGDSGRSYAELSTLRAARILYAPALLEEAWSQVEASPVTLLERVTGLLPGLRGPHLRARARRRRRAWEEAAGPQLRFIEPMSSLSEAVKAGLTEASCLVEAGESLHLLGHCPPRGA
jgi:hypothetical protein